MSKPSAKKLAKRNARAKQVKKALNIQTEAARRATQADIKNKIERKLNRRYNNTDDLVSGMINDSMEIFNKIETIRQICKGRIEQVQVLKNTEPTKYGALDSAEFDRMLEKITPMQELAKKMLVTAGKLEDMRKSEASSSEQMTAFVADMQNLSDLQVMYMDLMNMFTEVNDKFNDDVKHPKEADKTLGDISDELLDDSSAATDARESEESVSKNAEPFVETAKSLEQPQTVQAIDTLCAKITDVADITARDALPIDGEERKGLVFVRNASDDPSVTLDSATYVWDATADNNAGAWHKVSEEKSQQEVHPSESVQPKVEHQWPDVIEFDAANTIVVTERPVTDVDLSSIEVPEEVKQNPYLTLFKLVQAGNTSVCRNAIWSKEDNSLIEIPATVAVRVKQEAHPEQFFGSDIAK